MTSVIAWLDRVATSRRVALLLVLELLVLGCENLLVFPLSVPWFHRLTGRAYLDMCAFCSADEVYEHLDAFGPVGRTAQLLLVASVDVVIPTLSGLFGALGIALLRRSAREPPPRFRWLVLVPLLAALLDFTENALIVLLTMSYPDRMEHVATIAGVVTGMKSIAYVLTAVLLVVLALRRRLAQSKSVRDPMGLPPREV
jgi:hypothetical protein